MCRRVSEALIIETLAAVVHEVWLDWARELVRAKKVDSHTAAAWRDFFEVYYDLPEATKKMQRDVAKRFYDALHALGAL